MYNTITIVYTKTDVYLWNGFKHSYASL